MRKRVVGAAVVAVMTGSAVLTGNAVVPAGAGPAVARESALRTSLPCGPARRASITGLTSSGRVVWRTSLPRPSDVGAVSAVADTASVFADLSGAVTAVDDRTGRTKWSRALGTDVYGEWLLGRILVVDVDQVGPHAQIVGLDPTDGAVVWRHRLGHGGAYGEPVPAGNAGLVVVVGGEIGLVDAATGRMRWSRKLGSPNQPVADGHVVAVAVGGVLRGYAVSSGRRVWTSTGVDREPALTLDDGVVAVGALGSPDSTPIAGYRLATGRRAWVLPFHAGSWQLTPTAAGLVASQSYDGSGGLDLVEPATGRIVWRSTIGDHAHQETAPVVHAANLAMLLDGPGNGSTSLLLRRISNGGKVADYHTGPAQLLLTLATVGAALYGTGLGPEGGPETGVVERFGTARPDWLVRLPQPTETPPVALPNGGIAVQTEDLVCITAATR